MFNSETGLSKGAEIAIRSILKMMQFDPDAVIAQIMQIGQNVTAFKRDQDELLRIARENNSMLKSLTGEKTNVAFEERRIERGSSDRGAEQSQ